MKTSGTWYHTSDPSTLDKIVVDGWKPELNSQSKFGCAIYLSRDPWDDNASEALYCEVDIADDELIDKFAVDPKFPNQGEGNTERHFSRYLTTQNLLVANHAKNDAGSSSPNQAIRDHFLGHGTKAVLIEEHGLDVLIVYDPKAIRIIRRAPVAKLSPLEKVLRKKLSKQ
jgi:hypothetical protein